MKDRSPKFKATHVIAHEGRGREVFEVMLVDGAGYTRKEWNHTLPADYERDDKGRWTFQGQPFKGSVSTMRSTMRTGKQAIQVTIELTHPANKIETINYSKLQRKELPQTDNAFWLRDMNFWNAHLLSEAVFNLPGKKGRVKIIVNGQSRQLVRVVSNLGEQKADALFR